MGYSTPKAPFNLAEFLSHKAAPRSYRKPVWGGRLASRPTNGENPDLGTDPEERSMEEQAGKK